MQEFRNYITHEILPEDVYQLTEQHTNIWSFQRFYLFVRERERQEEREAGFPLSKEPSAGFNPRTV